MSAGRANEEARLAELMDYLILDTPQEEVFDLITQLACNICDVPSSLITFVARDRQWFKSNGTASKSMITGTETPLDVAFCAHAILDYEIMEVPDATQDERFKDNPLVMDNPKIRFYAGAPLTTQKGFNLGALCVISDKPKHLNEQQKKQLNLLAQITMKLLEARKKSSTQEEESWRLHESEKIKDILITNMSHELMTPLNSIVGLAQVLEFDTNDTKDTEQHELAKQILDRSYYLTKMITNMLEFSGSKIKKLEFQLQPLSLTSLVVDILDSMSRPLDFKHIHPRLSMNVHSDVIESDVYWLRQIIVCLMTNAIEMSAIEGKLELRLYFKSDNKLTVEVEHQANMHDFGSNQNLFIRDKQLESNIVKTYPGVGFNLLLVKQVVDALKGRVDVNYSANNSCTFYIEIPVGVVIN